MYHGEYCEDHKPTKVNAYGVADIADREKRFEEHRYRRGYYHSDDGGTDAAEKSVDARIFQQVADDCRDDEDDDEGGQRDAERRQKRTEKSALRCTDECRHIDGE